MSAVYESVDEVDYVYQKIQITKFSHARVNDILAQTGKSI